MAAITQTVPTTAHAVPDHLVSIVNNHPEIELETSSRWGQGAETESLIPSADSGKDAWLFLAAGFVIEIMIWGRCISSNRC